MEKLKILLIGQPNVGKSSLLNALVGSKVIVSNYPGTTVEITEAEKNFNNKKINFIDTPGIYSISDRSEEEKVTERALLEQKVDRAIVIADAVSLERSLYMVLQILEIGVPLTVALNFVEDAEKRGITINTQKLEELLNVPVIPINPITKKGIPVLLNSLLEIKREKQSFRIEYDDHIEQAIREVSSQLKPSKKKAELPRRFIATRILEEDEDFYQYSKNENIIKEIKEEMPEHPKLSEDISVTRYGTASFIAEKVTRMFPLSESVEIEEKIDNVLLNKTWGPLVTGLFLFVLFGVLLFFGNWIQSILMNWTEFFISSFNRGESSALNIILANGFTGLIAGISIALPYVFLFYLFLGLLEDIGLLSRFIINMQRFLKKLGLSGKSFIPLILGLGCTVPAIRATRILSSRKEKFYTASLYSFIPCSSRIAIIMGIIGFYGGTLLAFSVLFTLLFAGLIWILTIKKVFHLKSEPLLLELPPFRKPLFKSVLAKSWIRMRDFVYIVIPFLILGGITYGILNMTGIDNLLVKPLSCITTWLGLPDSTIIPLVFGFLQKDLTGAMLISVLGSKISMVLTPLQLYTFGVASTVGIPCIIALGILWKEFSPKKAMFLTGISIIYGIVLAGLIRNLILALF